MPEEKKKSWFRRHWIISSILGFFLLLIVIGMFQGIDNAATGNTVNEEVQKDPLPASYEEAQQKAVSVSYEDLMRYPESYENKWICFKGGVIQSISGSPNLEIRVATKEESYIGYFEDVVYVYSDDYSGERLLEDDIIEFCGISTGIVTYEAVLGNQISIPGIETAGPYVRLSSKDKKPVATLGQVWISAENFDGDPEIDGLKFSLEPKDNNGELVEAEGDVNIKLWELECTERSEYFDSCLQRECTQKESLLLETWSIHVNSESYDFLGANVQTEYKNYKPQGDKYEQQGCVEVTFVTPDGNSFSSFEDTVYLAGF